jgi:hypothetical protein
MENIKDITRLVLSVFSDEENEAHFYNSLHIFPYFDLLS